MFDVVHDYIYFSFQADLTPQKNQATSHGCREEVHSRLSKAG